MSLFGASLAYAQTAVPTPTTDRLAAPPTVPSPTQADQGAQLYWLNCQPCHGDVGQGLSDAANDDWRSQYPEDHQNCWESGCHGSRPYPDGFTLPRFVPAVIGHNSLSRFSTMADAYTYLQNSMPLNAPGSLPAEEYLAITAFLAREQGLLANHTAVLGQSDLATLWLNPAEATAQAARPAPTATPTAVAAIPENKTAPTQPVWGWVGGGLLLLLVLAGWCVYGRWSRQTPNTPN